MTQISKSATPDRADTVRAKRLELIRAVERLFEQICKPGFDGQMTVSLSSKGGRPGRVKATLDEWGEAT